LVSGLEQRTAAQAHSRRTYDAGIGIRSLDQLHDVIAFWEARLGQLYGFRWNDWSDFKSCPPTQVTAAADQAIGTGDGSTNAFQLVKRYTSGPVAYIRPIRKPVAGTVKAALHGVAQPAGWTVDVTTGLVTFSAAPGISAAITAGYEFDVPVRFGQGKLTLSLDAFQTGSVPSIEIREIRV